MNNIDEARIAAVKKKLMEAERRIYEANRIMFNLGNPVTSIDKADAGRPLDTIYPGQYEAPTPPTDDVSNIVQECVE